MAATKPKYPLGSPQEHIEMCESHEFPIDMICEDCDEFICAKCAKTDHRNHEWDTISTAASQRRRGLLKYLQKIGEEEVPKIDEKIENISKRITENENLCDSEIKSLEEHCEEIMARIVEIKKRQEYAVRTNLTEKNTQMKQMQSNLDKKKKHILETVEYITENNKFMSDYSLIDNHMELTRFLRDIDAFDVKNCEHSLEYRKGEIRDDLLENMIGKTLDSDNMAMTEINSFKYGDKRITALKTLSEDRCYITQAHSNFLEQVNKDGEKKQKFNIFPDDLCVTDSGDVYFTSSFSIDCLSPSGAVSRVITTDPMIVVGICQSMEGGFLVTFIDMESEFYKLDSNSRRLVKHTTFTFDVIHEYEYQEDGQTRLFTMPYRVIQNSNSDICVVNLTSETTGDLVIISLSGHMKSVYRGQDLTKNFYPRDVGGDSLCNILVTDQNNNQIHLLSPDGEFLMFLLTEKEVNGPLSLSLCKSTLWVGYDTGIVKVFLYRV